MVGDGTSPDDTRWGYVLTGGASRRMGTPKAVLRVGDRPMATRAVDALVEAGCAEIFVVGGTPSLVVGGRAGWVADRWPGEGPLGGVLTALHHAQGRDALIVAGDMPFLTGGAVRTLMDRDGRADAVVAVSGGRRQPLLGLYRGTARPALARAFQHGERSLVRALAALTAEEVAVDAAVVDDVDTPEELDRARSRVAGTDRGRHSGVISDTNQVPEIDVHELARRRSEGGVVLDVRQVHEYEEAHVPGAVLVPLDELGDRLSDVPAGSPLHVICRTGARSHAASEVLRRHGVDAVNVTGGTKAWIDAGFEVEVGPPASS